MRPDVAAGRLDLADIIDTSGRRAVPRMETRLVDSELPAEIAANHVTFADVG